MPNFKLNGYSFTAENCVDGVLINPTMPKLFDQTPNEDRPPAQAKWWNLPYVVTMTVEEWDRMYAERTDEYADAGRKRTELDTPTPGPAHVPSPFDGDEASVPIVSQAPVPTRRWSVTTLSASSGAKTARTSASSRTLACSRASRSCAPRS